MSFLNKRSLILGSLIIGLMSTMNSCQNTEDKAQASGIKLDNLDTTVKPGDNFYQYSCGGWLENNPLTGEYSRFGSFDLLAENNRKQLKTLITEIAQKENPEGSVEEKIAILYNLAMDSTKLNEEGCTPVKADLEKIASIKTKADIQRMLPQLMMEGIFPYFYLYVGADVKNSDENIVQTYQGGLGMGQRDYYLDNDDKTKEIRQKYQEHITKMFVLNDFDQAASAKKAQAILDLETRLATAAYDNVKLRDPETNYNKMTVAEAQKLTPGLNWETLLKGLNIDIKELSISQKESLQEVGQILKSVALSDQIAYLQWNIINQSASYMSDAIYNQNFDFYGKTMSGKESPKDRWKRAVGNVDGSLGEAVGQMYVKEYFPPEAKERMVTLVHNLQASLTERIEAATWMTDSTKVKAVDKLNNFYIKVGYPDKWRDYSTLDIKNDSYWANIKRSNRFDMAYTLAKLGKPVDKDEWQMTPQTVNAYYNPTTNEICFPAGILQYPFFDMNADDAFNYGAIGVVIGHEMTHGFDDQGHQFDKQGNLNNWWSEDDATAFDHHANQLADFFSGIEVAPDVHANGKFTLGENIADQGGLLVSYNAFQKVLANNPLPVKDNYTPEQRFFLAYANVWANNIRPEEILKRTKTDPHSLGKWRVNAALPHVAGWYEAFNIQAGDSLYIAPEDRAVVW